MIFNEEFVAEFTAWLNEIQAGRNTDASMRESIEWFNKAFMTITDTAEKNRMATAFSAYWGTRFEQERTKNV